MTIEDDGGEIIEINPVELGIALAQILAEALYHFAKGAVIMACLGSFVIG